MKHLLNSFLLLLPCLLFSQQNISDVKQSRTQIILDAHYEFHSFAPVFSTKDKLNEIITALKLDVFEQNNLKQYDTDLKKKLFLSTEEGKQLTASLKARKKERNIKHKILL